VIQILLHNPGLMVVGGLLTMGALVSGLLAFLMHRGGASLRPIVFFAGFFGIVVAPQLIGHLALAVKPGTAAAAPAAVPMAPALPAGVSPEDVSALYAPRMPGLQRAELLQWPSGDSVAQLRFGSAAQASAGLLSYLSMYQVAPTLDRGGNEIRGTRGLGGGAVHLLQGGEGLRVVTALSDAALDARLAALQPAAASRAAAPEAEPLVPALQPAVRLFREHVLLQLAAVGLLLAAACTWFFRASAWAASVPARAAAPRLPATLVRQRLLALGDAGLPVEVQAQPDGQIAVTWRHTDARWLDMGGLNRLRRTHRLLLRLDEPSHAVFVTEQWSVFDARAGAGGAQLRWHTARGITFFQVEYERVFGVMLGPDGRPTGALSHTWRFNLQELKAPFIAAATGSGWSWRPVMIDWGALLRRR
jgi:hypothetical protein